MSGADMIAAALARPDLPEGIRAFLFDVQRKAARYGLTPRQRAAVEKIASRTSPPDYAAINAAALARLPDVLGRLLPGGTIEAGEWHVASLSGGRGDSLRVRLRGERAGRWCDFATGEKGGDPISLAAAVARVPQSEAAWRLAKMLGMGGAADGR